MQTARQIFRWGGLALAVIGFWLQRTGQSANAVESGRILIWAGLAMIIAAMFMRLFIANSGGARQQD